MLLKYIALILIKVDCTDKRKYLL